MASALVVLLFGLFIAAVISHVFRSQGSLYIQLSHVKVSLFPDWPRVDGMLSSRIESQSPNILAPEKGCSPSRQQHVVPAQYYHVLLSVPEGSKLASDWYKIPKTAL